MNISDVQPNELLTPTQVSDTNKRPVEVENTNKWTIIYGHKAYIHKVTFSDGSICHVTDDTASGIVHWWSL